jgi:hypothetical protein
MTIHATVPAVGLDLQRLADGEIPDRPEDICRIARAALLRLTDANKQIDTLRERANRLASRIPGESTREAILEWAQAHHVRDDAIDHLLTEILDLRGVNKKWEASVQVSCSIGSDIIAAEFDLHDIDGEAEMDGDFTFSILREIEVEAPSEDEAREMAEEAAKEAVESDANSDVTVLDAEVIELDEA